MKNEVEISKEQKRKTFEFEPDNGEVEDLPVIDGELIEDSSVKKILSKTERPKIGIIKQGQRTNDKEPIRQSAVRNYILLPFIFLTAALFGGLRIGTDGAFIFLKPPLVCLIFAAILIVIFLRSGLIRLDGWFSESFSTLKNIANTAVLTTLFAASTQVFNSLLPEQGLPFWVFAFCFFWTLLNNLFSVFDAKRLLQSLGSLFGFAFLVKYLVLAYMTAPASESWWRALLENPTREFFTLLFDLPRFSSGTGYIQFFTVIFYLIGLFLLSPVSTENEK
ncbi:MAG TPA: hypothetical protein VNI84_03480 [Pyrinomonadaceae bacterium]|nr:hypothetical protein [Pyrinomonadaceae bacterium]